MLDYFPDYTYKGCIYCVDEELLPSQTHSDRNEHKVNKDTPVYKYIFITLDTR